MNHQQILGLWFMGIAWLSLIAFVLWKYWGVVIPLGCKCGGKCESSANLVP